MKITQRIRIACVGTSAALGMLVSAGLGFAADLTIADIAPKGATLIVGVDDFTSMQAAFDRTGMRKIWDEPSIQRWFNEATSDMTEQLTEMLESIDAKREDLSMPSGAVGMAMWLVEQEEPTDSPFAMIGMGDFGENAGTMHDTLMSALDEGEEEESVRVNRDEFGETTIYTIEQLAQDEEDDDEDGDEWEEFEGWEEPEGPQIETMYYARVGSHLLMTTAMADMENAIDRLGGKAFESIRDIDAFHAARSQIGTHDAYAVVLANPLFDLMDREAKKAEEEFGMPAPAVIPMLDAFGISEVQGMSMGVKFDADDGMMETKYGMLAEEMRGLLSLIDVDAKSFEPPSFVSGDVTSYTMVQLELSRLLPQLQQSAAGLPAEDAQQMNMMLSIFGGFLGPVLDTLGSEVYWTQTYTQPFSAESQKTIVAIRTKDEAALGQAMAGTAATLGMTSRDFQGSQIWTMGGGGGGMGAMLPIGDTAIGIGGGHMFFGPEADVEGELRQAAAKGGELSLANDKRFQRAAGITKGRGFSFSYMNLPRTIEYMKWFADNFDTLMEAQMQELLGDVDDPELRAMFEENKQEKPAWMENLPDLSIIAKHMGDSVTEFHRSDNGVRGRTVWLRPE